MAARLMAAGIGRAASMGAVFGWGGLMLMPVLFATGAPIVASSEGILVAGYMAMVPMFLGYLLFGFGLARVPASTATTITLTEPAVAALLAVLIVGERLSPLGWLGLGLVAVVLLILAVAPVTTDETLEPTIPTARSASPAPSGGTSLP
ncbi:MAG: DMT family transporter [Tessaracoccus sp.]